MRNLILISCIILCSGIALCEGKSIAPLKKILVNAHFSTGEDNINIRVSDSPRKYSGVEEYNSKPTFRLISLASDGTVIQEKKFDFIRTNEKIRDCPPDGRSPCKYVQVDQGRVWLYLNAVKGIYKIQILKGKKVLAETIVDKHKNP